MANSLPTGRAAYDFNGLKVLVTGGTAGIGLATAQYFADAGATVTITGTREAPQQYSDEDLGRFDYRQLSLLSRDSIDALCASVDALDVLVNNAGGTGGAQTPYAFEESVQVNLNAVWQLCQGLLPRLHEASAPCGASIVNVASEMSLYASPWFPGYGAAKAAVVQLTKTLAAQHGAAGLRCNAVLPGSIPTRMTRSFADDEAIHDAVCQRTPQQRWGDPAEIASAVLFLASAEASFVNGHTLVVDGGYSITDA
ncbi:SDR family NAD(P)-dependent oxidoreductase [Parahaliea mediterranea]|uniref:SDR family NAD(P)-dependent oxidoreductase n=1 Tax=Parahaliea mediterranea TaxID=651086 RepID=UPI000E2ED96E|nr:SDR family oxidoreductase [Parahaliea mediterranea]